jgi:D-serine deaminase-like pyridoxal phosphate-dependent protein
VPVSRSIEEDVVGALVLGPQHKAFPPASWGKTAEEFASQRHPLAEFQTPTLTLDERAMSHNVAVLAEWTAARGLRLAPHGKTTMAPALWQQVLDAGAWGITLATGWQVQLARSFGVRRILLANALVDPVALRWLAGELGAHPDFEFFCWADSVETVTAMESVLGEYQLPAPVSVIVELGALGGRTGARTLEAAVEVAGAVRHSPSLRLAGVGGYEGALAHDRTESGITAVIQYLDALADLHEQLVASGAYEVQTAIVTAGGSAYFELVAERLERLAVTATVLLRSGAYQVHDDGFYRSISPFAAASVEDRFRAAMHGWARVVSRPEAGLAILDGGRRDFPFDEGMPTPQLVVGESEQRSADILRGSRISKLNDQHAFLELGDEVTIDMLPVGSVVRLGLSHPCTAFDKWRAIPVLDDASQPQPLVIDVVQTYF